MGMIYRRRRKRPDGTVIEGETWWIKYYANGRAHRESAETASEKEARQLLKLREGDVARGVPHVPRTTRVRCKELTDDVIRDYRVNGKRSLEDAKRRIVKHLVPFFGERRAAAITTADIQQYTEQRQGAGASNGEINRELSLLRRAFNLGARAGKVLRPPYVPMLKEDNVRTGFFERAQFEDVRAQLPADIQPVVHFAYLTGWRVPSEVQPLQWRQVDFHAGTVRLKAGSTKNGEAREFPFTAELRALLEQQRAHTDQVQREQGRIIPYVFHRQGKPILYFKDAWESACKAAGCPGMIRHDFRRTAVRNLVRAGIPERVAMTMTGHKTRSVFERYNIVSPGDLRDAARRLDEAAGTTAGTTAEKVR
ncbi:MAG: tyrosine-type recombinase/integrase [Candidatus Binatia bacterium]|jgi:integrase